MILRWLTAGATALMVGCGGASPDVSNAQTPPPQLPTTNAPAQLPATRQTVVTQAVARVAPAVVTVQTETVDNRPVDPFEYFFGGRARPRTNAGLPTASGRSRSTTLMTPPSASEP